MRSSHSNLLLVSLISIAGHFMLAGCKAEPRNPAAVDAYYRYDFTTARQSLRRNAFTRNDRETILNNTRLGMAALADGDLHEAELALSTSFELLSTAGLNRDRTVAAVLDHEGVRIWKGEPFEQALTYHYVALLYAMLGDWENVRAAATNALFRLTDFGKDQNPETLTRNAAKDDRYLDTGYTAVDTNFALGFLMQAIGSDLSGMSGAREQYDAALAINADLAPIVDRLRSRDFDTLLVVDYGKGPIKQAYGPDNALVRFVPSYMHRGSAASPRLVVHVDNLVVARANAVCDVDAMAQDHRWNNLEDIRRAKSVIGDALLLGGAVATAYGADRDNAGTMIAGVGAMALGLLTKAGARADTRYCEFMPKSVYLVPVMLQQPRDLTIEIDGQPLTRVLLNNVRPGTSRNPRVVYLRVFPDSAHGRYSDLSWMTRRREYYSNDYTGVMRGPAGRPWILGGRDVSTPTRQTLQAYQANGYLTDFTHSRLEQLYVDEGISIGSGAAIDSRTNRPHDASYRHILEGGTGLFTPYPHSMGYLRIMRTRQLGYKPRSDAAGNVLRSQRVMDEDNVTD